jgi:hypothetical protein
MVLLFATSELMVLGGVLIPLPRGTLSRAAAADIARAPAAAGLTPLLFSAMPPLDSLLAIPLCIATFAAASWLVGLLHRDDVEALRGIVPKPAAAVVPCSTRWSDSRVPQSPHAFSCRTASVSN